MTSKPRAHRIEKKWRSEDVKLKETASFTSLLLTDSVLAGLRKAGFKTPSPIQLEAIPVGRFGKDLVVQAKSGTGKTLVFTIVALEMLLEVQHPQVLVLAPTREIAFQICSVIKAVGSQFEDLKCCTFIGGTDVNEDKNHAHSCQIAVGTPGRVKQLIDVGILKTNSIRLFVLDEADQLLENSFLDSVDAIFLTLPKDKQVIATSATYPTKLKKLVNRYFRKPYVARLNVNQLALLGIIHYTYIVNSSDMAVLAYKTKLKALEMILTSVSFSQCLVFCNMVSKVQQLSSDIKKWGFSTVSISSAKGQTDRLKAIEALKRFKCKILVSSDLTARGIDAENVDLVMNFDIPLYTDVYLHRSGRAGRYGSKGVVITFLTEKELEAFKALEIGGHFESYHLPDPIPENLISIRPQGYFEKVLAQQNSSDASGEQIDASDSVKEEDECCADEDNDSEGTVVCNKVQTQVSEVSESCLEGNFVSNGGLGSNFEVKITEGVPKIPLMNSFDGEFLGTSTENDNSQSDTVDCMKSENEDETSSPEIIKSVVREDKPEEESSINDNKVVTKKGGNEQTKLKSEVEKEVDVCKIVNNNIDKSLKDNIMFQENSDNESLDQTQENTLLTTSDQEREFSTNVSTTVTSVFMTDTKVTEEVTLAKAEGCEDVIDTNSDKIYFNDITENLSETVPNIQTINDSDNEYLHDMCLTLSNFIELQKKNKDVPKNSVKSSDESTDEKKMVCSEDIAHSRYGLNDYYIRVFKSYTGEYMPNNPEVLVEEGEAEKSISSIEKEVTHDMDSLLEKQPPKNHVDDVDSMEDTESSSEIESYLDSTHKHNHTEVFFSAVSNDEFSGSNSSSCESLNSMKKKASYSTEPAESISEDDIFKTTSKQDKGEVIYIAKPLDESSDSSGSSSSSSSGGALKSVFALTQKFKEMVQESYKKHPPRNGIMPKLSKATCRKIVQSTAEQSQAEAPQGTIFISSSGSSTGSEASFEVPSESSFDIDSCEIQRPKQRRGPSTSSASSTVTKSSRGTNKPEQMSRRKKSQSSRKSCHSERCNLMQNNEACGYFPHHHENGVFRPNLQNYYTGHGYSQCINPMAQNYHCSKFQSANQQPYYHQINYATGTNQETYNAEHGNFQCTNSVGRHSHCNGSLCANQQPQNHLINCASGSNHGTCNAGCRNFHCTNSMERHSHCNRSQCVNQTTNNPHINYATGSNEETANAGHGNFQCNNSMERNPHCNGSQWVNQQPYNPHVNYATRSNQETANAGHGNFQCNNSMERNSHCNRSQCVNQQPFNHDINFPTRSNQQTCNRGRGNLHCSRSQYANGLPFSCAQPSPNHCGIPHTNSSCPSHFYNQWLEIFQRQMQCMHYSTYFQ